MPSRYTAAHAAAEGVGDNRPTAFQIVKDEGLLDALEGKAIMITGCSSGIGVDTARALYATGASLYLTARNMSKARRALADISASGRVHFFKMDQTSLESVKDCVREFLSRSRVLNILICNAGVMAIPELTRTTDGFETQFAVNHLSHFLLFCLLKHTLLTSSAPSFPSRVVCVSSSGHRNSAARLDDYNYQQHPEEYAPFKAYGASKTCNIYMANEIERRYGNRGLHGLSLGPGGIATGLQKYVADDIKTGWAADPDVAKYSKSQEQGAATTVYAAVSKEWEGRGGRFLEDCTEAPEASGNPQRTGYEKYAYDEAKERQLWIDSLRMIGMEDDDGD